MVNALAANITLSTTEQELFGLLKQVLITENLQDTQLRCAGGWVRDKLLGKQSIDIDIALNNLYGEEFAGHVNAYLQASSQKINKVCLATCSLHAKAAIQAASSPAAPLLHITKLTLDIDGKISCCMAPRRRHCCC